MNTNTTYPRDVYFFGTCILDMFMPQAGMDAMTLLESLGINVHFPMEQSCCGQPAYSSGHEKEAFAVAKAQLDLFPEDWPIVVPSADTLCITPVAPHSLNIRPIVVKDDSVIRLEVESRSHNFLVAIDGRSEKLCEGTQITIRKAPYEVQMVKLRSARYFSTLREKLMWGADQRG